ncbi:hypothetical protein F4677DRAFT_215574 [Hypoxylon crocopeplum]|nr:hypothetical protein F4677DRAFT_215574 [Hypoxylon crocopeplum]
MTFMMAWSQLDSTWARDVRGSRAIQNKCVNRQISTQLYCQPMTLRFCVCYPGCCTGVTPLRRVPYAMPACLELAHPPRIPSPYIIYQYGQCKPVAPIWSCTPILSRRMVGKCLQRRTENLLQPAYP